MNASQQKPYKTVFYIGAGGGGDTNAAMMRAWFDDTADRQFVLGAGYTYEDYYEHNVTKTNQFKYEAFIAYLQSVTQGMIKEVQVDDKSIYIKDDNVWNIKFPGDDYELPQVTSKYKTMIEEVEFLNVLESLLTSSQENLPTVVDNSDFGYNTEVNRINTIHQRRSQLLNSIYMFVSTETFIDKEGQSIKQEATQMMYNGLKDFIIKNCKYIIQHSVDAKYYKTKVFQIVIMDFGGDIFDFGKFARDSAVLTALLHMIPDIKTQLTIAEQQPDIQVTLEVFGPGVDAHKSIEHIAKSKAFTSTNTNKTQNASSSIFKYTQVLSQLNEKATNTEKKQMYDEMKKLKLIGPGRATGNFLKAHAICSHNGNNVILTGGIDKNAVIKHIVSKVKTYVNSLTNQELKCESQQVEIIKKDILSKITNEQDRMNGSDENDEIDMIDENEVLVFVATYLLERKDFKDMVLAKNASAFIDELAEYLTSNNFCKFAEIHEYAIESKDDFVKYLDEEKLFHTQFNLLDTIVLNSQASSGGSNKSSQKKLHILGRERTIIKSGRTHCIRYKNALMPVKEAKALERQLAKQKATTKKLK
jgi:hypothetical protein